MTRLGLLTALVCALVLSGAARVGARVGVRVGARPASISADTVAEKEDDAVELANIRSFVLQERSSVRRCVTDPDCPTLRLAKRLRQFVYNRLVFDAPVAEWDGDLDRYLYDVLGPDRRPGSCGPAAIVYLLTLRAFGIDARFVALFGEQTTAALGTYAVSHATVEVSDGHGAWYWFDPTYNFTARPDPDGRYDGSAVLRVAAEPETGFRTGRLKRYSKKNPKVVADPLRFGVAEYLALTGESLEGYFASVMFGPSSFVGPMLTGAPPVPDDYASVYPYCLMATADDDAASPLAC